MMDAFSARHGREDRGELLGLFGPPKPHRGKGRRTVAGDPDKRRKVVCKANTRPALMEFGNV
jgi:hypothetical protein